MLDWGLRVFTQENAFLWWLLGTSVRKMDGLFLIFSFVSNTYEGTQQHLHVDMHPAEAYTGHPLSVRGDG